MDLTLEAHRTIVRNVGTVADIAVLLQVSRAFRIVSERALYNTLLLRNDRQSLLLCRTLTESPRIAACVNALTIFLGKEDDNSDSESDVDSESDIDELPDTFWPNIAKALRNTVRLRYLNMHVNNHSDASIAWILRNCKFQLRKFHCDINWDDDLVHFLNGQAVLADLYLLDYRNVENLKPPNEPAPDPPSATCSLLHPQSLQSLAMLECTFSEAAMALTPGRPITHLKTCFSRTELGAKRDEMYELVGKIALSKRALRSLDLADSSYTEQFSTELLAAIATTRSLTAELRYLGILVLPIDGRERLQFYALLRHFPKIQCVEFEVTDWEPQPSSPPAQRALAGELRLYVPSVTRVIFVIDFDRSVVKTAGSIWREDLEISSDLLWRQR